ncbi:MAG: hypothetical protein OMOMHJEC_00372 [Xanthomonadales bacterium]|nr:hypothetical protein [Xanthomonadales bacterium]
MKRATLIVVSVYGIWCLAWLCLGAAHVGDGLKAAHLALMVTAPPLSLFSLYFPHGTLHATLAAALLGLIQWASVAEVRERYLAWRGSR